MKGVRGLQRGRRQAEPAAALDQCRDRLATARNHSAIGRVLGGDRDPVARLGPQRAQLIETGADRGHRTARGQILHQSGAPRHQPGRGLDRTDPGRHRRRELADAVADDQIGHYAPRMPQLAQRDLHREQRRLGVEGARQAGLVVAEHRVAQGDPLGLEQAEAAIERTPEIGLGPI